MYHQLIPSQLLRTTLPNRLKTTLLCRQSMRPSQQTTQRNHPRTILSQLKTRPILQTPPSQRRTPRSQSMSPPKIILPLPSQMKLKLSIWSSIRTRMERSRRPRLRWPSGKSGPRSPMIRSRSLSRRWTLTRTGSLASRKWLTAPSHKGMQMAKSRT